MTKQESLLKPSIELLIAALFWGFGFTATVWCLEDIGAAAIIFYRSIITFAATMLFFPLMGLSFQELKLEFKHAFLPGLVLGLTLVAQSVGLKFTTATNSAFLTVLYVIFVPVMDSMILKKSPHRAHWLLVALALLGTGFIVQLHSFSLNTGDVLTILTSILAAIHILQVGHLANKTKNAFLFNGLQFFWCAIVCLLGLFSSENWNLFDLSNRGWFSMISLSFGSSLLAFYLMVRAQKRLSNSVASLLFLLESPFSMIFAFYFLNESLNWIQSVGALLIFVSCALAVMLPPPVKNQPLA